MMEAKFRVNPRRMSAIEQMVILATMNGLLRPKRELELSDMTPAWKSANAGGSAERRLVERTDEGLDDEARERASNEHEGHQGFREAKREKVWRGYTTPASDNVGIGYHFRCGCLP
jgi:hypothetical protein